MHYAVQIGLSIPADAEPLDELRATGGAALLSEDLRIVDRVEGPEAQVVRLRAFRCWAHDRGIVVGVVVEAAAQPDAETAMRVTMAELLAEHAALAGWEIASCDAHADEEFVRQAIEEGGEASAVAWSRPPAEYDAERTAARSRALAYAPRLRAFTRTDLEELLTARRWSEAGESHPGELLAGALFVGVYAFFDDTYHDLDLMQRGGGTVDELRAPWVLDELPPALASRYTIGFVRRFLLAAGAVAHRLVEPVWQPPACFAEALALRLILLRAYHFIDGYGLLDDPAAVFERLEEHLFEATQLELLRLLEEDDDPWGFETWFAPAPSGRAVHPYTLEPDPQPA